ncbi:MAG: hypothetical protein ABIG68_12390 [Acidobacteriota bacterium]
MRVASIIFLAALACLPFQNSAAVRPGTAAHGPPGGSDTALLDLVPGSALVAVDITGLAGRWREVRAVGPVARIQDAVSDWAGFDSGLLPGLAGDCAVVFLAPAGRMPSIMPVAILRPCDPEASYRLFTSAGGLSRQYAYDALWLAPSGEEDQLDRLIRDERTRLSEALPKGEMEANLPPGGLLRGWLNPVACRRFLLDFSRGSGLPAPLRAAAAVAAAELDAVRYAAFRRDLEGGQLVADGIVAYDPSRLPPQVAFVLDPGAARVAQPQHYPAGTVMSVVFRPEGRAWLPWLHYLAGSDPSGPFRNLGFWLDEFQARYRRDLERDLFGALGDRGLVFVMAGDRDAPEFAAALELREPAAVEATLLDVLSWIGEQTWLGTFGLVVPRSRHQVQGGLTVHALDFWTPLGRRHALSLAVADGQLLIATRPEILHRIRGWVLETSAGRLPSNHENAAHGSVRYVGPEAPRVLGSLLPADHGTPVGRFVATIAGAVAGLEGLCIDMHYGRDAICFRGSVRFRADASR